MVRQRQDPRPFPLDCEGSQQIMSQTNPRSREHLGLVKVKRYNQGASKESSEKLSFKKNHIAQLIANMLMKSIHEPRALYSFQAHRLNLPQFIYYLCLGHFWEKPVRYFKMVHQRRPRNRASRPNKIPSLIFLSSIYSYRVVLWLGSFMPTSWENAIPELRYHVASKLKLNQHPYIIVSISKHRSDQESLVISSIYKLRDRATQLGNNIYICIVKDSTTNYMPKESV